MGLARTTMCPSPMVICRAVCDRELTPTALKAALVVGTLLLGVNHGPSILRGTMTRDRWLAAGLTYLIPYSVSIHGQYTSRQRWQQAQSMSGDVTEPKIR